MKSNREPLRILHVFGRTDRGGAETMIMTIYRKIDRTKLQFDFIVHTKEKCDYDDEILDLGGKIFSVPRYHGSNHLSYTKSWRQFFKAHPEYQIIHGHISSTASIYLNIAKQYHLKTILHSHSTSYGKSMMGKIKSKMQESAGSIAGHRFACSEEAGRWLFGKQPFQVIHNAIDAKKFKYDSEKRKEKRKEFGYEDHFVIGHVGRFDEAKNHALIIDVFKEVYAGEKKARLLLVGDGALRAEIEKKVKRLGLKDVVMFTGVRSDIPELFQAMDVFLFPSLYEGLPVTLIEAQAAGLPLLVSDVVSKEVDITGEIYFFSLKESAISWAEKLLEIRSNKRKDNFQGIVDVGYDVLAVSKLLQKFYLSFT